MLRGEIWAYRPQGSPREPLVVLISSDGVNQSTRAWLLGAPIATADPEDILAVPVSGYGWADAGNLSRFYRRWLAARVDVLDAETLDGLDTALRAALDL